MSVRLIKGSWWIDFTFDYQRYRKRSPDNSRAGARAFELTLRQRLARGEPLSSQSEKSRLFAEFAAEWFEVYVVPNNKFSEQYAKKKILSACLLPFFGTMSLSSIGAADVERFKAQQKMLGVSNKTINNRLAVLSKCLRSAHDWYDTPMPIVKLLRCAPAKTDYLTPTECEQLLQRAQGQLFEMVFLALRTGMRQGEIRGLQWPSIDWQSQLITVRHSLCDRNTSLTAPKNGRERHIPLDIDVRSFLYRRKQESGYVFLNPVRQAPYTSHRLLENLANLCVAAGIRKIGWHVLRHTFATQLTMRRVPLTVVKELLGHSSITTTMRYSHVAPSALRAAIDALNPRSRIPDFGQPAVNREAVYQEYGGV